MKSVGVQEVRKRLSAILDEVANGETIELTRNGKPVARLVPAPVSDEEAIANNRKVVEELRRLREQPGWPKFTREEAAEMIREGREERDQQIERALGWRE